MKLKKFIIEKQICMHICKIILPKQKINFKRFSQQYNKFLVQNRERNPCFDTYLRKLFGNKDMEEINIVKQFYFAKKEQLMLTITQDFDLLREIYRDLGYSINTARSK